MTQTTRLSMCALSIWLSASTFAQPVENVTVGSKMFTESVVLGEIAAHLARSTGASCEHRRQLGGSQVLFKALRFGDIDVYPEYTGTIAQELYDGRGLAGVDEIKAALADDGVQMTGPLGFNNSYVLGMKRGVAKRKGIARISDLKRHADLRLGFSTEFMDRGDGWPSLSVRYGLQGMNAVGLEHDLAYRGLDAGSIDVMDLYATDAEIEYYDLLTLEDDLQHFPAYHAVCLYRADLPDRLPEFVALLRGLEGRIDEAAMVKMNANVKLHQQAESAVAAAFLKQTIDLDVETTGRSMWTNLATNTWGHLELVAKSLTAAILVAIPIGIAAAKSPRFGQVILGAVGIIQTIPSLAMLVFMIPLLGIGGPPAIAALFLYSLLPIVRNTHAGLHDIPGPVRESAEALGLSAAARLWLVELPMSSRAILAGIKTSAVINVGTATLGALIGAGGYGQPIMTGIRKDDISLILQGAIPAALLALAVQGVFELIERGLVPRGMRLANANK